MKGASWFGGSCKKTIKIKDIGDLCVSRYTSPDTKSKTSQTANVCGKRLPFWIVIFDGVLARMDPAVLLTC